MNTKEIRCAFCKGAGKDPFDLLSELATCQVCAGKGKVEVVEPAIKCAFAKQPASILVMAGLPAQFVMAKVWLQLRAQLKSVLSAKAQPQPLIAVFPVLNVGVKGWFQRNDWINFSRKIF